MRHVLFAVLIFSATLAAQVISPRVLSAQGDWKVISNGIDSAIEWWPVLPRDEGAALTLAGRIWVLGFDSLQVFDPAQDSWSTPPEASAYIPGAFYIDGVQYHGEGSGDNMGIYPGAACAVGGSIYSFGGFFDSDYTVLPSRLHVLDTVTLKWSEPQVTGYFTPRMGFISAVINDKIYAIGGNVDTHLTGGPLYSVVQVFDPVTKAWSTLSTIGSLIPSQGQASCVLNGKIYVLCGAQYGSGRMELNANQVFDPSTNTWSLISSNGMYGRWYPSACALNGKIYVIGGESVGPNAMNEGVIGSHGTQEVLQIYDPSTDTWSTPTTTGTFDGVFMAQSAVVNGKIYIIGGDNGEVTNEVQVFEPSNSVVAKGVNLSPNPTLNGFTVSDLLPGTSSIEVTNILGETIASVAVVQPPQVTLDLTREPVGTYFVRVATPDGVVVRKVLKE